MTSTTQAILTAAVLALATGAGGLAAAADRPAPHELSNSQMDQVAAGGDPAAVAEGKGDADGKSARSGATVASYVRTDPTGRSGGAMGQVTASATAHAGALATATSNLSLSVSLP